MQPETLYIVMMFLALLAGVFGGAAASKAQEYSFFQTKETSYAVEVIAAIISMGAILVFAATGKNIWVMYTVPVVAFVFGFSFIRPRLGRKCSRCQS